MLLPVWPGLNFWFRLAIISSPLWVISFLAMKFIKKTTGLVVVSLISTLTFSWSASIFVLSKFYHRWRRNQDTNRFFSGYESAGKTIGFALLFFGNVGLYYFSEKSVACMLTFLFLAFYCLCFLLCIQPYTDFGALEFLLSGSLNQTLHVFGLRSPYSWLVIIVSIVIAGIRYRLEPAHPLGQATSDEVDEDQLEAGLRSAPPELTKAQDESNHVPHAFERLTASMPPEVTSDELTEIGPPVVAPLSKVDVPPEVTTESTVTVPPEVSAASTEIVALKETVESTESTPPEETESAPSQATESLPVVKVTTASSENMPPEETESAPLKVSTASSENIPLKPTTMSPVSVLPPELTQAQEDANQLNRAFKGWSCDAPTIVKILAHRNATQRDLIRKEYNTKFNEDLDNRLSKELSGDLKRAVLLWMHDPTTRDAVLVNQGLTESFTHKVAIEVICSRTPSQIEQLKKAYRPLFGSYLEQDIESHASGGKKKLLLAYVSKSRSEGPEVDKMMVDGDAKALFEDGEYKLGTHEETFIRIFSERSRAHLAAVDAAYRSMYVNSLRKAIKHETAWNFKYALLTILQFAKNPAKYFAKELHKAMVGIGTDEKTLSRIIVTRAEIDIEQIKAEYLKKYKKSLSDEVHSETSGNYRAFLVSLLDTHN